MCFTQKTKRTLEKTVSNSENCTFSDFPQTGCFECENFFVLLRSDDSFSIIRTGSTLLPDKMANPVYLNNTTRISLNDRFTIMQSVSVPSAAAETQSYGGAPILRRPRSRSRSRSVSRMAPAPPQIVMMPRDRTRSPSVSRAARNNYREPMKNVSGYTFTLIV